MVPSQNPAISKGAGQNLGTTQRCALARTLEVWRCSTKELTQRNCHIFLEHTSLSCDSRIFRFRYPPLVLPVKGTIATDYAHPPDPGCGALARDLSGTYPWPSKVLPKQSVCSTCWLSTLATHLQSMFFWARVVSQSGVKARRWGRLSVAPPQLESGLSPRVEKG